MKSSCVRFFGRPSSLALPHWALSALLAAALFTHSPSQAEEREPGTDFRVLTHNVFLGFARGNGEHHARWREWMAETGPDVVSLQELNGYTAERINEEARGWGHPHSVILKEDGFPTALTSRWPIEEVARLREGFHHGLLRGRIRGVTVYVVHFHPANWEFRIREAELLAADIAALPEENPRVLLAGDFNGFSPADRAHYETVPDLVPFFKRLDARGKNARNLNAGRIDYGGIEAILAQGFVDLHDRFRDRAAPFAGTFPSELVSHEDHGPDRRLDYLFANETLASLARRVRLLRDEKTARFSDHFPLYVDFALGEGTAAARPLERVPPR